MKIEIKETFDFRKLSSKMKDILKAQKQENIEALAQKARENIQNGVDADGKPFQPIRLHTEIIRREGLSPNAVPKQSDSTAPLIHTGKLLKSIKATKTGIRMKGYGSYHLTSHTTTPNNFTKWYEVNKRVPIAPRKVPARNFMPNAGDIPDKSRKELFRLLRKALRK